MLKLDLEKLIIFTFQTQIFNLLFLHKFFGALNTQHVLVKVKQYLH
jgi:hypothetical protein